MRFRLLDFTYTGMMAVLIAACGSSEVSSRGQSTNTGGSLSNGVGGQSTTGSSGTGGSVVSSTGSGGSPASTGSGGTNAASGGASGAGGSPVVKPPVIPPGKAYLDDFEDGDFKTPSWIDADPSLGGMWSVVSDAAGDAGAGNKVFAQKATASDWIMAASGDYRWTDQIVEAKAKFTSDPGSLGIFARFKDQDNYYFLYLDGSNIVLRKRSNVGGNSTSVTILKVKQPTVVGTWYTLKLSVIGSALIGYLDDKPLVMGTDTDIKGGGIAVGTDSASAEFDDVTVTIP